MFLFLSSEPFAVPVLLVKIREAEVSFSCQLIFFFFGGLSSTREPTPQPRGCDKFVLFVSLLIGLPGLACALLLTLYAVFTFSHLLKTTEVVEHGNIEKRQVSM